MKKILLLVCMLAACGQEPVITDGSGQTEQGQSQDDSTSTVSIDLYSVFEALCTSRPDWSECAKWCELHPESTACS